MGKRTSPAKRGPLPRLVCPLCGRSTAIRPDKTTQDLYGWTEAPQMFVRHNDSWGVLCPGSGRHVRRFPDWTPTREGGVDVADRRLREATEEVAAEGE